MRRQCKPVVPPRLCLRHPARPGEGANGPMFSAVYPCARRRRYGFGLWRPDLFETRFNGVRRFAPRAFRPGGCAYFRHRIPDAAMSRMLHVSGPVAGGRGGATKRKPTVHPGDVPAKSPVRGVPINLWDKSGRIFLSSGRCFLWCVYGSAPRLHGISDNGMGCIPPGGFPVQKGRTVPAGRRKEGRRIYRRDGHGCLHICRETCGALPQAMRLASPSAKFQSRGRRTAKGRRLLQKARHGPVAQATWPAATIRAIFCKVCHFIRSAPCKTGL